MTSLKLIVLVALFAVCSASSLRYARDAPAYPAPAYPAAAPAYPGGRVKIQVYRGPNAQYAKGYDKGYDDGAFAPWGYYATQPEDHKGYYGKY